MTAVSANRNLSIFTFYSPFTHFSAAHKSLSEIKYFAQLEDSLQNEFALGAEWLVLPRICLFVNC